MRGRELWASLGGLLVAAGAVQALTQDVAVPIVEEPRHPLVFEIGTTRVHDVQIPPGDTTLYHVHDSPILYVPIGRSATRSQVMGQPWAGAAIVPSAVPPASPPLMSAAERRVFSVVSYVDQPLTHRVNNIGSSLFRLIAIVNRAPGGVDDSDDQSALSATPEIVNRYYRAHRLELAPGRPAKRHSHVMPVVVVQQSAGRVAIDGSTRVELSAPGSFAYHNGVGMHGLRNLGDAALDVTEVEIRGARPQ